jgi:glucose/arabinose dehydrogenase/cytochrome c2
LRKKVVLGFLICFLAGMVFATFGHRLFHNYLGISAADLIRSPRAALQIHQRGWESFEKRPTKELVPGSYRQNLESILLPLVIEGHRLSDHYPVPKMGGALAVVRSNVLILDRLGGLYQYDLNSNTFRLVGGIPRLPNNLEAYLAQRPDPAVDITEAPNDELRARSIVFLFDRNELAVAYDEFDESVRKLRTVVSTIPFDANTLTAIGNWKQVFASDTFGFLSGISSGGGILAYRGDGILYLTIGDHYIVDPKVSEDLNSTFGKIFEINLATNTRRVISKGHRNPEGLTILKSGRLMSTEHGPYGGDELNIIEDGGDYGWPNVTLGTTYNAYKSDPDLTTLGSHEGYKDPLFAWLPSVAPSQLIEIGHFHSYWNGDLLVGSLKASSLYRIRVKNDRVLYSERIWLGERVRDLAQTEDGTIVVWTDDSKLLEIRVDSDLLATKRRTPPIVSGPLLDHNCLSCHHFGPTNPTDFAPSLSNLLDRPIASDKFAYSTALRSKQKLGNWTPALLSEFLSDPFKFASGTNMLPLKISPQDIEDIVATLVSASEPFARPETGGTGLAKEGPVYEGRH